MSSGDQAERIKAIAVISGLSSFMANVVSCTITHPLDLIRTRAYFKYYNKDINQHYSSIYSGIMKIYYTDGFLGFFNGLAPRIFRKGLGSIITWTCYEFLIDKKYAVIKID